MAVNQAATTGKSLAWSVRDEDLQDLEQMKRELIERGDQARTDGRLYLAEQYTKLVSLLAPEIKRIRDRFDRDTLAAIRKEQKELRLQAREEARAASEAAEQA